MSYPFRTILSPVDFDENSLTALEVAKQMALDHDGTVHLLHVVASVLSPEDADDAYRSQEENVRARLAQIAEQRLAGIRHEIHARAGDTAKTVAQTAAELKADVVVIATHGRTGLTHLFLGSVAEHVVRESHCPVLTVRPPGAESPARAR